MARRRPTSPAAIRQIAGVGDMKLATFGEAFLNCIRDNSRDNGSKVSDQRGSDDHGRH
jgi:hypothetical protein